MQEYKIGKVAGFLGIAPQSIRLYEQKGIALTAKDDDSGYRKFGRMNINVLAHARTYRSLGFTMDETAWLLNQAGPEEALSLYEARESAMAEEIHMAQMKLRHLKERREAARYAVEHVGACRVLSIPGFLHCTFMRDGHFVEDQAALRQAEKLNRHFPFVQHMALIRGDDLMGNLPSHGSACAIDVRWAGQLGLGPNAAPDRTPEGEYVHAVFARDHDTRRSFARNLGFVLAYMDRNRLELCGDVLVDPLLILKKQSDHLLYAQAFLPVRREPEA